LGKGWLLKKKGKFDLLTNKNGTPITRLIFPRTPPSYQNQFVCAASVEEARGGMSQTKRDSFALYLLARRRIFDQLNRGSAEGESPRLRLTHDGHERKRGDHQDLCLTDLKVEPTSLFRGFRYDRVPCSTD